LGAATVGEFSLHLASSASPNDVFHSGWLGPEPEDGPDYVLRLDPADSRTVDLELIPRPGVAPDNPMFSLSYNSLLMTLGGDDPTNQVFVVSLDGDGIVYHSRLLTSPLTLVGKPRLRLALVPDADDADLAVLLHVVLPSGDTVLLSSDLIRLSRRDRGGPPRPLVPGEVNVVDIDDFRFCARELPIGSRLRLTLRSAWSPLTLPALDGLTAHPVVTLRLVHRAEDGPVLRLPLGYVGEA
jgi:predicted acyl esterase